ncbi:ComF family protein [Cupriavidus basilensis]|uniref:ComF family protein n=1 Tax=Cupriavidus basilensis TaxID=68895 RepID=UPI0023E82EC1|nr:ComF family protein [Cupriavidus basilensis]MDF3886154.1 ComF family protein [Cupriavidus basilensis]
MQGHGQTRRQENGDGGRSDAPVRETVCAPADSATGPQVYAPAAAPAGGGPASHPASTPALHLPACPGDSTLRQHARRWMRALLPAACALCGTVQDETVCAGCAAELLAPLPRCRCCARPLGRAAGPGNAPICSQCRYEPPPFDATLALGDYASPQDGTVLALKFGGVLPLADWLASELASRWQAASATCGLTPPDVLAPIPLSPRRLAERGFNQSWEIARPLARRLGVRAAPTLLARLRDTPAQATLDLAARQANLQDAFGLGPGHDVAGLHVGLVDDVMTSGATLGEAARVLKAHGATRVTLLVALRTP